jgi:hypothetical protein
MLTPASRFEILRPHTEIHNTSHMRTKTLLLTAALAAAGAASAMAQNVYSVNAVGYVNKSVVPGYSIVANPFIVANESLDALVPTPNDGTVVYKPVPGTFEIRNYDASLPGWDPDGATTINLGAGVIFFNPGAAFTVTFVGEVKQGSPVSNPVAPGLQIKSSQIPQAGLLSALGFSPVGQNTVYQYAPNGSDFIINIYDPTLPGWDPSEPVVGIAEGFWIDSAGGETWSRNFTVN